MDLHCTRLALVAASILALATDSNACGRRRWQRVSRWQSCVTCSQVTTVVAMERPARPQPAPVAKYLPAPTITPPESDYSPSPKPSDR